LLACVNLSKLNSSQSRPRLKLRPLALPTKKRLLPRRLRHFASLLRRLKHFALLLRRLRHFASLLRRPRHFASLLRRLRHFALLLRRLRHFALLLRLLHSVLLRSSFHSSGKVLLTP